MKALLIFVALLLGIVTSLGVDELQGSDRKLLDVETPPKCEDGYWYDKKAGKCKPCKTKNCKTCVASKGKRCKVCMDGYFLDRNKCLDDHEPPEPCEKGFYYDKKAKKCKPCKVLNCSHCIGNKGKTCKECFDGFFLSENNRCTADVNPCGDGEWLDARVNKCRPCKTKNCKVCVAGEGRRCKECLPGYDLKKNKCV